MSLQKVLYAIKGAAREQRSLADQCIHAPKLKASSLQNAADMDAAAKYVEDMQAENGQLRALLAASLEDTARVDHLQELIRQCPHVEFDFCDDDDESRPLGFSITLEGCSGKDVSTGDSFRECVDEDMKLTAQRNSE